MSQRVSGYTRITRDEYNTPSWVTEALLPHMPQIPEIIWEPAAGSGKMAVVFEKWFKVKKSDIATGDDFLKETVDWGVDAIITNPPYDLAQEFITHALYLTECGKRGFVAMLLRTDFDHAKTRARLFGSSSPFAKKLVLTKRIKWFEDSTGSPSFNHAWYLWDWQHIGPPTIAYGPSSDLLL